MSFLRNHKIKQLTKKATDYVIAQLVDYLKFSEQNSKAGEKKETENEALQVLFYIFIKNNDISPKSPPQDNALLTLGMYVIELVNLEIPVVGNQKDIELITETIALHLQTKTK